MTPRSDETRIPEQALLEHAAFVRRVARSLVRGDDAVDDVVQQTYLAALESPPRQVGALRAWLARVARNFALKRRAHEAGVVRRERRAARPEGTESTASRVERAALLRDVTDAVLALDEPYREAVLLRYFDGLEPAEIAERTGVPASTVRSRLQRALARLRGRLDREHDGRAAWLLPLSAGFAARPLPTAGGPSALPSGTEGATGGQVLGEVGRSVVMASGAMKAGVAVVVLAGIVAALWSVADPGDGTSGSETGGVPTSAVDADEASAGAASAEAGATRADTDEATAGTAVEGAAVLAGEVRHLADDRPAEGVAVTLTGGPKDVVVRTDAAGQFAFANVPPGGPYGVAAANPAGPAPAATSIWLAPRERHHVGALWLSPPLGVQVEVVDEAGVGVSGATVEVHPVRARVALVDYRGALPAPAYRAETDDRGRAALSDLTAGVWTIRASHADHAPGGVEGVDVRRPRDGEPVRIVLERGAALTGRVTNEADEPLPGIRVVAAPPRDPGAAFEPVALETLRVETVTDAEGRYRFPALARGAHSIGIAAEGGTLARIWIVEIPKVSRYDLQLHDRRLFGRVTDEATGAGLPDAVVRVGAWRSHHPTYWTATTDAQGNYAIAIPIACALQGPPRGEGGGVVRGIEFDVTRAGYVVVPGGVDIAPGASWLLETKAAPWNVTMRRAARLAGVVRGPDGPVPGAEVRTEVWNELLGSVSASTVTDGAGRYVFDGLLDGRAKVTASRRGLYQVPASAGNWLAEPDPPEALVATIPKTGAVALDVVLEQGRTLVGRVVATGGEPVPGATVRVAASPTAGVTAGPDGSFELDGVPAGEGVTLRAEAPGFAPADVALHVPSTGDVAPVTLELAATGVVRGRVAGPGGAPPAGVYVQVVDADVLEKQSYMLHGIWERMPKHPVGAEGTYAVPVPAGVAAIRVRATAPGKKPSLTARIDVSAGGDVAADALEITAGHVLAGRVVRADGGGGVAGATIEFVNARMPPELSQTRADTFNAAGRPFEVVAVTGEDGQFRIEGLPAWDYQLRVIADNAQAGSARAHVPSDEPLTVELRFGSVMRGHVRFEDGTPAAGVAVLALGPQGAVGQGGTDPEGAFVLRGLPLGAFTLRVQQQALSGIDVVPTDSEETFAADAQDVALVARRGKGRIEGTCVTSDGRPIPGVYVTAKPMTDPQPSNVVRARADLAGRFVLTGLGDGPYAVIAQANRGVGGPESYGTRRGVERLDVPVGTTGLRLEMQETVPLAGRVVREDGEALPFGTVIHLTLAPSSPWKLMGRLANDGSFTFPGVQPLPYTVAVIDPQTGAPLPLAGDGVVTPGGGPVELVIPSRKVIAGVVVDGKGHPVSGVQIVVPGTGVTAVTDDRGRFQLSGPDGASTVDLAAVDHTHGRATLAGVAIGRTDVRLRLAVEDRLAVVASGADGEPLRGRWLQLAHRGSAFVTRLRTDAKGRVSTAGAPAGEFDVSLVETDGSLTALGPARSGAGDVRVGLPR